MRLPIACVPLTVPHGRATIRKSDATKQMWPAHWTATQARHVIRGGGIRCERRLPQRNDRPGQDLHTASEAERRQEPELYAGSDLRRPWKRTGGGVSPTLTGDHQDRITDYTALVVSGCFQETGRGWVRESGIAETIRTPVGSGSQMANLIVEELT